MKRRIVWVILITVASVGAAGWYGYGLIGKHALVARHRPAVPAMADRPAVLAGSIEEAEARSRSWLNSREGLVALSRLYHANSFYAEAIACYEGLREMEPGNARWPHLQASIVAGFGRMDEALPLREKAVELAPDYIPARLRLGDVLLKNNRVADAAKTYAEVLHRVPGEPYALLGLARCDLAAEDWSKARERLQAAIAKHPGFVGALSLLVTVSERLGDTATAQSVRTAMGSGVFSDLPDPWLDELLDVCYDAYLLSVAASTASFAGDRTQALALIERAIGLVPNVSTYRRQAGQYLLQDSKFAAAKNHLEKAVQVNPLDSESWLRYLDALRGLGQMREFVTALNTGLAHCPESSGLHLENARWLRSTQRFDEAIAEFRYVYQLRPSEAAPLVEIATLLFSQGRSAEAVEALNEALERQPDHPMAVATLTLIAISNNDEREARRRFEEVRRQAKVPLDFMDRLRQAFQQQFGRGP